MNQPAKILFKYTSRSRPNLFFRGLESIVNNVRDKQNYHVLCTFDENDTSVNNKEFVEKLRSYENVSFYFGESKNKVNAINKHMEFAPDFDILVNFSDDQIFTCLFFDQVIRIAFLEFFPDYDGFLHIHDGNQNRLATMSIIGRKHYELTGRIYPDEYASVYCDNHVQNYAKLLGRYQYLGDEVTIMNHLHPIHGKASFDAQYMQTEHPLVYNQDRQTFLNFKENNFGLKFIDGKWQN